MNIHTNHFRIRRIGVNNTTLNVATGGSGPAILFLHGWPHTWEIWRDVMKEMQSNYTVIAPDLRGLGASAREERGYDLHTLADDAAGILDALGLQTAGIVGIDLGVAVSWMLAARHPARASKLVVMEGLLGTLPGAETFVKNGPPWWFGFHQVPGFAEKVLEGNEAAYIDEFLLSGTKGRKGVATEIRRAFIDAYSNRDAMRCGFEHYRALPENARQIKDMVTENKLELPVMAIAGGIVGSALAGQLRSVTADLTEITLTDCAHLIPLEQSAALVAQLRTFL
ncbi:alpha/beta hydrolase fold protein [Serratia sp. AS12]|uniref:alpha/beta fold hydrolase n=1 Tax=Serratia TaxID=613 RepID=UPI00020E9B38|nr:MULTISPECIES: alpha/beta hydrolase [Serratia]AEF47354.1 alpha/beta hydrolase fold [Serratia plymuthica AS9]AEF52306.1 alpha/beta hydrolase fold protein [Serratia sp. AS12]AEG30013.1 alpha/beta hydrolase fold protein [Serratia sp. AS13]UTN96026.1 alpha/beta hydrolase [Serratia plymuthica]